MKSLFNLFSIFSSDVDKKINKYLVTHKFEDLKRIDRKKILVSIYKAGKEVVVINEKLDNAKRTREKIKENYLELVCKVKDSNGDILLKGQELERAVTKCEIKKQQVGVSDELVAVLETSKEVKVKRFNDLVNFLAEYDSRLEYGAAIMDLNKTKVEVMKLAEETKGYDSTLLSDVNEVSKEYELEYKANKMVSDSLNNEAPAQPKSLDERIANL